MLHEHFNSDIDLTERNACRATIWVTLKSVSGGRKKLLKGLNSSFVTCLQVLSGAPEDY